MSEDIDIKLVPRAQAIEGMSRNKLKNIRKDIVSKIEADLLGSEVFSIKENGIVKRNEYRFSEFSIIYPQTQPVENALRPHLKLDLTESRLLESAVSKPVTSLYAEALSHAPEVASFPAVGIHSTASEKLVALLRRTAHVSRDSTRKDDSTLVRHAYDLHLIVSSGCDLAPLREMVKTVMATDAEQFGGQHSEFLADPAAEMHFGLSCLHDNPVHRERYEQFIGPLVYHEAPASWDEALDTVTELTHQLIPAPSEDD